MVKNRISGMLMLLFVLSQIGGMAQIAPNKYWVSFNDKSNNGFDINSPLEFLTQRSIDRRINQSIAIDEKDMPVTQSYIDQVDAFSGVDILYPSKWFNSVAIFTTDALVITEIENLPFVSSVRSLHGQEGKEFDMNNDAKVEFPQQNQRLDIEYGQSFNQIDMLNGTLLHDAGYEGEGMLIATIDAGFRLADELLAFEALFDEGRIVATKDFVDGDDNVFEPEVSTHGMFVLSTMAGILPDSAYGSATQASYILLRSEDTGSELRVEEHNWIAAAEYADSLGADLLTTSLGYTTFDDESMNYDYDDLNGDTGVMTQASDIAASRGMLVINSAGNSGSNDWHYIGIAADGDSVLAIGAVNSVGIHASFSSFGPSSDGRVKPNVMAQGRATVLCDFDNTPRTGNGTSFSGPLLAGMAACLWQMHPSAGNMQVFHAIEQSASLYETPNDSMGFGIPDFWQAHLILQEVLSIEEYNLETALAISPNPVSNQLSLHFNLFQDEKLLIEVVDQKGSVVVRVEEQFFTGTNDWSVRIDDLADGLYLVRIKGVEYKAAQRFVVDKK